MCKEDDTIGYLKEQISIAYSSSSSSATGSTSRNIDEDDDDNDNDRDNNEEVVKPEEMRLVTKKEKTILDKDDDKISDHESSLKNDSELYVVFQIGDGEWEDVRVEETDPTTTAGASS
mmetsp:Transcript_55695/g.134980  ORF Transcript_55695/g.134980 Transcript_55695/m.134980 type:complete len:118 (+) Transcript_55695:453-806(+)